MKVIFCKKVLLERISERGSMVHTACHMRLDSSRTTWWMIFSEDVVFYNQKF